MAIDYHNLDLNKIYSDPGLMDFMESLIRIDVKKKRKENNMIMKSRFDNEYDRLKTKNEAESIYKALTASYTIPPITIGPIKKLPLLPEIKKVIFNKPATIVLWADGTKTVVKVQGKEKFNKEKGLAMAIAKKALGNQGNYYNEFDKWLKEE